MVNVTSCVAACAALGNQSGNLSVSQAQRPLMYWSNQASEVNAACYAHPSSASGVARVIKVARDFTCPFAVSGGGHNGLAGFNNLQGGITIDLSGLNETTLSADRKTTRVGAGLRWRDVYAYLDTFNLTAVGGREASVGVAGLTLGGGISYVSSRYGLATDNVKAYEVVLADGSIVTADHVGPYKDLYKALRGGGNNFGIVTKFDLDTYPQGLFAGGLRGWTDSAEVTKAVLDGFTGFVKSAPKEPNAHLFINYGGTPGSYNWGYGAYYALPDLNPPVFQNFKTPLLESKKTYSTERITDHSGLAADLDATQPYGVRNYFHTASFKCDVNFINSVLNIYKEEVARVQAAPRRSVSPFLPTLSFQPLTSQHFARMKRRGGNSLGLEDDTEPLFIMSSAWSWSDPADDDLFKNGQANIMSRAVAAAKKIGAFHRYYYMNYATASDPVIEGYGKESQVFLKGVARRYDPHGVFQKLVPGGWKLTV